MKTIIRTFFASIASLCICCAVFAENHPALNVIASTPVVTIEMRDAGRTTLELPSLDYSLQVFGQCDDPLQPVSLSLGVADTRRTIAGEALSPGEALDVDIAIPAGQIAPLAIAEFCAKGAAAEGNEPLLIPAVLSMQASLLCGDDERSERHYVSSALGVQLECTGVSGPESDSNPSTPE